MSKENHIWLNSLSKHLEESQVIDLINTTQALKQNDEKNYADSLWEVVTRINTKTIKKIRKDDTMCKALAEIMKPEIEEAFNNGFNDGVDYGKNDGKILVFRNMINDGMSRELAQKYAELSDEIVKQVLATE